MHVILQNISYYVTTYSPIYVINLSDHVSVKPYIWTTDVLYSCIMYSNYPWLILSDHNCLYSEDGTWWDEHSWRRRRRRRRLEEGAGAAAIVPFQLSSQCLPLQRIKEEKNAASFLPPLNWNPVRTCLVLKSFPKSDRVAIISNLAIRAWSIKRRRKKIITKFGWKLRDERFEPN